MVMRASLALLLSLIFAAPAQAAPALDWKFPATDGTSRSLREHQGNARYLVVTFFSATCPCQALHDPRLLDLHRDFADRGVAFVSVDSEADSSLDRDREAASARGYPFPILSDPQGKLADAFGAKVATHTVVLDVKGAVVYSGGIDSDRVRPTPEARQWLRLSLERLLRGKPADDKDSKAFGCYLRRR